MSVWCSFAIMDGGDAQPRPIGYRESHIVPAPDDPRAGSFDLAYVPGFITRDGRDNGPEEPLSVWPYLRVGVAETDDREGVTVVLNAGQVEYLRDQLTWWLSRVGEQR